MHEYHLHPFCYSEKTIELEAAVSRLEKTNEDQSLQYQKEQEAFQHNFERQKVSR